MLVERSRLQAADNPVLTATKYRTQTLSDLKSAVLGSKDEYIAVDTETTGLSFMTDRAFGVALCWDDQATFIRNGSFEIEHIGSLMKDIFASDRTFVFHNAEFLYVYGNKTGYCSKN